MAATTSSSTSATAPVPWKSCFREHLFQNKVALVTGGGTGLGKAIAWELATLGATVVIASRSAAKCQATANQLNAQLLASSSSGGRIVAGPSTNIRQAAECKALVTFCVQTCGALHLLVNNAGGQFVSPAEDISPGGFSAVVETNLTGTFVMCREAYQQYMQQHALDEKGGGCAIVNITLGNRNGMPLMAHSGAARAGVENLTATLCTEWIESGVRINCVRPGVIWTDSGFENYGPAADDFIEKLLPSMPAKRFGTAEEISSAVVWLLSEGASYVTGNILCVDGGSAYTFLPLVDIEDKANLPFYGTLPRKARL